MAPEQASRIASRNLRNHLHHDTTLPRQSAVGERAVLIEATVMTSPEDDEIAPVVAMTAEGIDQNETPHHPNPEQHTAEGQAESLKESSEQAPNNETEVQADIKNEPMSGDSFSGEPVAEGSQTQVPNALEQSALPQPDLGIAGGYNMASGMSLELLAALTNPMAQMNMFPDPVNNMGYYPQNTVPGMLAMPMAMDTPLDHVPYLGPSPYIHEPEETRISAYAKLCFDDGFFYMNTYSVVLGRDLVAYNRAIRDEKRREKFRLERETNARDPYTPVQIKHEASHYSKSIVSESGGILRAGDDSDPEERRRRRERRKAKRASRKSKSDGSSSALPSRRNSEAQPPLLKQYEPQELRNKVSVPETAGAVPVDPSTLRPSPYDCPLVAIHPPASAPVSAYKAISREHVKIAFNSKKSIFEAIILGRNGAFIQDEWYHANDVVPLESEHVLQIGGITVRFVLPNQVETTAVEEHGEYDDQPVLDRYSEGGKEMSLEFTDERREGALGATSDEGSDEEDERSQDEEQNSDNMEEQEDKEEDGQQDDENELQMRDNSEIEDEGEEDQEEEEEEPPPVQEVKPVQKIILTTEKKRGPGRPPKNGIMSKREQREAKRAEQAGLAELANKKGKPPKAEKKPAEKTIPQAQGQPGAPTKNKVGRPRKHPLPEIPDGPPREKRKYTKRKPKEPREPREGDEKGDGSGSEGGKVKKEKNPPRPPRSPSPPMKEEDYTEAQMAKPQANYVTLIHEALSNAPTQQLGLPDIYRAIYRKYPYFKFKTQTLGWQSSVRHNLSQHHAFRKVEKDGKGWTWGIVDGISIEKEKKKRATPPPQSHPGQMQHQPLYPGYPPHMGYGPPPPGFMMPPNMPPGQHPQYRMPPYNGQHPPPMHMNGQPPPGFYPHMTGPPIHYAAKIPPQLAAPNTQSSYSSPYAPKPPVEAETPKLADQISTTDAPSRTQAVPAPVNVVASPMGASQLPQQTQNQPPAASQQPPPSQAQSTPNPPPPPPQVQSPATQTIPQPIPQTPVQQSLNPQPQAPQSQATSTPPVSGAFQGPSQRQAPVQVPTPQSSFEVQPSTASPPDPPTHSEEMLRAVETFRKNLTESMRKTKGDLAETIVNTAIDRVLASHVQSGPLGDSQEDMIEHALRGLLSKLPGSNVETPLPLSEKPFLSTAERQSLANQQRSLGNATHQPARTGGQDNATPTVTRPSFNAQGPNRPNGPSVPRPPMTTPGYVRTNSEGTVHAQSRPSASSASPAPTPSAVNGASTAKVPTTENGQTAGQKRSHDDSTDDMREFKRMSTSGPPSVKT